MKELSHLGRVLPSAKIGSEKLAKFTYISGSPAYNTTYTRGLKVN